MLVFMNMYCNMFIYLVLIYYLHVLFFRNCQLLHMTLNDVGFDTVSLHAMISQRYRLAGLAKFKSHVSKILIATDVASRGLDIPAVSLVINYTIPNNATDYIHRVGRTARAGKRGRAVSIITQHDVKLVQAIEQKINIRLKEYDISGTFLTLNI